MVTQTRSPRKAAKVRRVPAKRVKQLLLEVTYHLHVTRVVERLPVRSKNRELAAV